MMNELTTSELVWLVLGQLGLLLVMVGGVWIGATNHERGRPSLPALTIWLIWVQCVAAAVVFTHPFATEVMPALPPVGHGFRLAVGLGFIAYPVARRFSRFGRALQMSRRVESIFTYLVGFIGLAAIGMAGFYGVRHYRAAPPSQEAYIARQAQANGNLIKEGTELLSNQVDSLTQLTSLQAGQIVGLREEMGELSGRLTTTNALLARVSRKMDVQGVMLTRLLGKPSLPVEQTGKPSKAEATLSPYRVH